MFERRSLKWPIALGVLMIVTLVVLIVGWILLAVFGAMRETQNAPVYWTVLTIGSLLFVLMLVGVITYLVLTIKAFNLNRRQSNFVDSVTHELKSPIASLKLYLQTISRHNLQESERREFVQYMLDDVERLDSLITHLLVAGNMESRLRQSGAEWFNLADVVQEATRLTLQRNHIEDDSADLELDSCSVFANRIDFEMVVGNLVENALKYGGRPARVRVVLRRDSDIRLTVEDNGEGIPRGQRNRVFGRFVRLGNELERKQKGTGLGLFIVRMLSERLGGTVAVGDSETLGGARFEVRLPATLADVDRKRENGSQSQLNDNTSSDVASSQTQTSTTAT